MGPACRDQPRLGVLEGKRGRGEVREEKPAGVRHRSSGTIYCP